MRAVIIGGAPICDYNECKKYLGADDFYIFCDSGLYHKEKLGVTPSLIIGDFDSLGYVPQGENVIEHPKIKNDTDPADGNIPPAAFQQPCQDVCAAGSTAATKHQTQAHCHKRAAGESRQQQVGGNRNLIGGENADGINGYR